MHARSLRPYVLGAATAALLLGMTATPSAHALEPLAATVRFNAPQTFRQQPDPSQVQWRHEGEASQWSARVSLGQPAPERALGGEVQWLYRGLEGHALTLGALAQRDLPPSSGDGAAPRFGAYVNNEWQLLPAWRVLFGARADRRLGGAQALAPSAALLWQALPSLKVKLLDGVAYREPGASLSPLRELVAQLDPSLGNERLRATELGLDWHAAPPLRLAAALYRNDAAQPSEAVPMGATQGPLQFQNLGRANGDGIELGGDFAADDGWQLRASWAAALTRDGDAAAIDAPRSLAKLQASALLPWQGARAMLEWWRMGPQGGAFDAQSLVNATMDWAPIGSLWTVAASAYNLTGRTLANADPLLGGLARDGRRLQLELGRNF